MRCCDGNSANRVRSRITNLGEKVSFQSRTEDSFHSFNRSCSWPWNSFTVSAVTFLAGSTLYMMMSSKTERLMISRNPGSAVEELRVMPSGKHTNRHAFMLWFRWAEVSLHVCRSPFFRFHQCKNPSMAIFRLESRDARLKRTNATPSSKASASEVLTSMTCQIQRKTGPKCTHRVRCQETRLYLST